MALNIDHAGYIELSLPYCRPGISQGVELISARHWPPIYFVTLLTDCSIRGRLLRESTDSGISL